jgi:serine/threonine protein kinase
LERALGVVVAGRYRLVRMLGSGGMGTVWLAHDLSLDSECALKLIDDDKAASEEVRIRFEREARAAAQVRGAHVVDIFDHGEHDGVPFIAMEYLDGEDLEDRLRRLGRLDGESTYRVIAQVSRALVRAHSLGIVHRDLKPENIFLVPGDEHEIAKVLDFGIAKHDTYSLRDKATKTGSFLGTPYYVSPEQARGKAIDYRSDLWSLGVIAFQCLTGRPPFESEALGELMGLILYEDLPKPSDKNPELSPALDEWWQRAASRDPEQRFQSAKELADSLAVALGVEHVLAVPHIPPRRPNPSASELTPALPAASPSRVVRANTPSRSLVDDEPFGHSDTTGAPVSRTRRSLISFPDRLRRRHLAGFAVGGVALGILVTLLILSAGKKPKEAPPIVAAPPVFTAVAVAEPEREVLEVFPAPAPSASVAPVAAAPAVASSTPKKKKGPPPPPRRGGVPDYGI